MLIGEDFPKIDFSLCGMDLVEPNSLIGNSMIFLASLYCSFNTRKVSDGSPFFKYWSLFYLISGITFFTGGLSHVFFNRWGIEGKYFSWIAGIVSVSFIELAMVSIFPDVHKRVFLNKLIMLKLLVAVTAEILVLHYVDLKESPAKGIIIPTVNSVLGLGVVLGGMGYYYQKKLDASFKYLWMSAIILIPITAIQAFKINLHPWFDRNDLSHLLLILGCFLYLKTIRGYAVSLGKKQLKSAAKR